MMNQPEPNRLDRSVLYLARFTLETKTALSIGSGGADNVFDHPIVRDANGLPQIPGSSLAGVLRHLWITDHPEAANKTADDQQEKAADGLFGFHHRDKGSASRIEVAACALQDQDGKPVEGLLLGKERQRLHDPLLAAALISRADPNFRDRVRLTHRGVAAHTGKFDRGLLPAGYRFSGELRLWSTQKDDPNWNALLALLADTRLRLGGGTRAGLGAMTLKKLHQATFALKDASDIKRFQKLSPSLGAVNGLEQMKISTPALAAGVQQLCIKLNPKDFWRIGQGDAPLGQYEKNEPTLLPKQERIVTWQEQGAGVRGKFSEQRVLVPGSSIKGALAHRTAFHWNVLNKQFIDDLNADEIQKWDKSEHCDGVMDLFGFAKNSETAEGREREQTGQAGRIIIDDVYVNISAEDMNKYVKEMVHNSIDRFTGGVRNRMLFTEELIFYRSISLKITLLPGVTEATAYQAFARALSDLCSGSLAIGGGVTKGHGAFSGEPDQTTRDWLIAQGAS
ncbi:hypothetical protein CKO12_09535 [Chromatium okenii]|uniref:RAMP superfamily CRISPR-associated protein n=1 Tax=Chromatium okenii TaxID=61644 RepID=UPI001A9224DA|nr:RAMP superfamily CRISPR-associated protein [Chromatium okenii]MBK1642113.1 hypothetical protein [Chromatium okenii]